MILTSISSAVGEGSCMLNHGGELKVQQEHTPVHSTGDHCLAEGMTKNGDTKLPLGFLQLHVIINLFLTIELGIP